MKNIVLVKLNGGLGNQMFQYALAQVIASKHKSKILLDKGIFDLNRKKPGHTPREYELKIFDLNYSSASKRDLEYFERLSIFHKIKRELHFNYPQMCYEKNFSFDSDIINMLPPVYLRGFFQSYKYYLGYEKIVKQKFQFPENKLGGINLKILDRIKITKSVSVHIRRGDYVKDKIINKFHGVCSKEYYQKAISKIIKSDADVEFFFFSDEIQWVENEFRDLPVKKTFVTANTGQNSWKDMCLMGNCKNNIIANSSFSWWAAWLNENSTKKVIAPKKWFKDPSKEKFTFDLIPDEWIRI